MKRSSPKKSFLPRLMALAGLAGLLLLPQATSADLWVSTNGAGANNCVRQATEPAEASTCTSLVTAAASSTSGETIRCSGDFSETVVLKLPGNVSTTWTRWSEANPCSNTVIGFSFDDRAFAIGTDAGMGFAADNVTIENLDLSGGQFSDSIGIMGNSQNATIRNNTISSSNRGINNIQGRGHLIEQNEIYSLGMGGIGVYLQRGGAFADSFTITRNNFHDITGTGVQVTGDQGGGKYASQVTVKNNFFTDIGTAVYFDTYVSDSVIYNNSFYGNNYGIDLGKSGGDPVTNIYIRNNAFDIPDRAIGRDDFASGIRVMDANATSGLVSDYNDFYLNVPNAHTGYWLSDYEYSLSDWQTASGGDANSTDVDPDFADPGSNNLHITSSSAINDLGVNIIGMSEDYDGDPRPNSQGDWSMGADQRDDGGGGIPEFSLLTMMLALFSGLGVIFLISKLKHSQHSLN